MAHVVRGDGVKQAALTITADNQWKVYGAALPELAATYTGFVKGDTPASLITPPTLATMATAASHVGSYPITASGVVSTDYTIVYVDGTLTVTPAALTITAEGKTKVYWQPMPELTATYIGFANGDTTDVLTAPPTLATAATKSSPVGDYPITVGGAVGANYTIAHVDGTLTVLDSGWQNAVDAFDVTGEGEVSALDVLTVINYINANPGGTTPPALLTSPPPFYDVSGDGQITAEDVLDLINYINARPAASSEAEAADLPSFVSADDVLWTFRASAFGLPLARTTRAADLTASPGERAVAVIWPAEKRREESQVCRVASPVTRPADLDWAELAHGDLESVLESLADEIGAAWSQPPE